MLQNIRDLISGWLAMVVISLLAIPFALWGINNYFSMSTPTYVAKVADMEISSDQFRQRLQLYRRQMQQRFGDTLDSSFFEQPVIKQNILDVLINEEVLRQSARASGFAVPDSAIQETIAGLPFLQIDGKFSAEAYRTYLTSVGNTFEQFQRRIGEDLLSRSLRSVAAQTSLVSDPEVLAYIQLRDQTRRFDYELFQAADFADQVKVDEAQIETYYQSHPEQFKTVEKVKINYVELDAKDLETHVSIDEQDLKSRYDQEKSQFVAPEQRIASHILLEVPDSADAAKVAEIRARAQSLADRARKGEDFAALAKANSQDAGSAAQGGDLGEVEQGMMTDAFDKALFSLAEGAISDPVRTEFGFHVIYNRKIIPEHGKTFAEVRDQLQHEIEESESERLYLGTADRLYDAAFENDGNLLPVAEELGLEVKHAGPFARGDKTGIAANPAVLKAAFSDAVLVDGSTSDPIDLGPNHVMVLRVAEHIKSKTKPLKDVHDEIQGILRDQAASKLANEAADKALDAALNAKALVKGGDGFHADIVKAEGIGRQDYKDHPQALITAVFQLPHPQGDNAVIKKVSAGASSYAVVALSKVSPGDPEKLSGGQREDIRGQLESDYGSAETAALFAYLRSTFEIDIQPDRM